MGKITIDQISKRTGLSRGTVSRALNDRPDIREGTKQRVLAECKKLNYVPSRVARSLATGRCFTMGIVVGGFGSHYIASLLRGAIREAHRARYAANVVEVEPAGNQAEAAERMRALANERVDGVLLAAAVAGEALDVVRHSFRETILVACVPLEGVNCDVLRPDDAESGRIAARHLLLGGSDGLAYFDNPDSASSAGRKAGFLEVCAEQGVAAAKVTIPFSPAREAVAARAEKLRQATAAYRRFCASDDALAMELMFACMASNRMVGRDVAVIGHGNEPIGAHVSPGLTSIDPQGEQIGRRAMEVLVQRAEKTRSDAPQEVCVPPELVERGSTRNLA